MDTDHCGGWIQIFGGKASDCWKVQLAPLFGVITSEFLLHHKIQVNEQLCGIVCMILCSAISVQHQLVTKEQTDKGSQHIPL